MGAPRRARKVDGNQAEIVKHLRKIPGIKVALDHDDILVGYRGRTLWYEIKNPDGRNRKQEGQTDLENEWPGHYKVVSSLNDILLDMGVLK